MKLPEYSRLPPVSTVRKITVAVLLFLLLSLGAYVLFETVSLHPMKNRLAVLERQRGGLIQKVRRMDAQESQDARNREKIDSIPSSVKQPELSTQLDLTQLGVIRLIHREPELEANYVKAEIASIGILYSPLFRALKLSVEQQDQVLAVLATRAQNILDIKAESVQHNQGPTDPGFEASIVQQNAAATAELQRVLGLNEYNQLKQYETTLNARAMVGVLASNLYYNHPLSPEQGDRLIAALAATIPADPVVDPVLTDGGARSSNWDAALTEVTSILTPEQFATFRAITQLY